MNTASKLSLPVRVRTLIVGDFNKVPRNILEKIVASGIRMKQGCVRDNEEVLIGPSPQSGEEFKELVGIIINPIMVRFFGHQFESLSTKGHDLIID